MRYFSQASTSNYCFKDVPENLTFCHYNNIHILLKEQFSKNDKPHIFSRLRTIKNKEAQILKKRSNEKVRELHEKRKKIMSSVTNEVYT